MGNEDSGAVLRAAFPWGAHVTVASGASFLSLDYDLTDDANSEGRVTILFVREQDHSDTLAEVTVEALEAAAATGLLRFDNGGSARQPEPADLALLTDEAILRFVGPQSPSDKRAWIRRMRLHQSWWRAFRLRSGFGPWPTADSPTRYGTMLDAADADAGRNFLSDDARAAYDERWALTKEGMNPFRTRRHLMASQTMAFNLFGHLDHHRDLAAALFDRLLGPGEVEAVDKIEIELLSDALGDHTAFDAFVTYTRPNGSGPGCIAIETKLTEPFSQTPYDWARYLDHGAFDTTIWKTSDPVLLGDLRWSQLWRNHLLAVAHSANQDLGPASLLVVHHPADPDCDLNIAGYCEHLHDGHRVRGADLGLIHSILDEVIDPHDAEQRQWLGDLADRYLHLHLSEELTRLMR